MARIVRDEPDMTVPRPLAGRYAFIRRLRGTQRTIIWFARDAQTGQSVVASVVPGPRAAALEPAVGISHPNVATLLAVLDPPPASEIPSDEPLPPDCRVAIAEHVEGGSLQLRVDAGPIAVESAVDWIATTCDVLATFHDRAAVHGAVSPRALVVARADRGVVPVLAQLLAAPSGAYCSPERVTGGGPSEADDTWALAGTLYTALTRRPPFGGATRRELARAIVLGGPPPLEGLDPRLRTIVMRALATDPRRRFDGAAALGDALRTWMREAGVQIVGDFAPVTALVGSTEHPPAVGDLSLVAAYVRPDTPEASAPLGATPEGLTKALPTTRSWDPVAASPARNHSSAPPKPVVKEARPSRAVVALPRGHWRPLSFLATLAGAAFLSATVGLFMGRWLRPGVVQGGVPAEAPVAGLGSPKEEASPAAVEAEPPATMSKLPADPTACVRAVLPEGTFRDAPTFDFLCHGTDLWGATRKMNSRMGLYGHGTGLLTWAHLGRYDLAAVAALRDRCCPAAAPAKVATAGICESLTEDVRTLARDPSPSHVDRYGTDIDCLMRLQFRYPSEYWDRVTSRDARAAFERFLGTLRK
jgi:serine/threonine-protein kinase